MKTLILTLGLSLLTLTAQAHEDFTYLKTDKAEIQQIHKSVLAAIEKSELSSTTTPDEPTQVVYNSVETVLTGL